jgi:hypothetical protein
MQGNSAMEITKKAFDELVERYNLQHLFQNYNNPNNTNNTNNNFNINKLNNSSNNNTLNTDNYNNPNSFSFINDNSNKNEYNDNIPRTNSVNNYTNNNANNVNSGDNDREQTKESQINDQKITNLLNKIKSYEKGDPVDLYLKSRNIKKGSKDIKIYTDTYNKVNILVNEIKDPKKNDRVVGINEIFLTKDGKKRVDNIIPTKIHRIYNNCKGNTVQPVRLSPKGDNNGFIYVTEGIENGLSLQEHINNEVWCSLSINNFLKLPYESNKRYIFVFDNDCTCHQIS